MAYSDLVIGTEVVRDAINSTGIEAADEALVAAITDVSNLIEEELNTRFIVQDYRLRVKASDWYLDESYVNSDLEPIYIFRPDRRPVVEIKAVQNATVIDVSALSLPDDGALIGIDIDAHDDGVMPVNVDVFAGYRRADQDLAALQTEHPTLTVLPPVLPAIVRRTAVELVLHRITMAENKLLGGMSRRQVVAGSTITVERADPNFERRLIRERLTAFRRFNA